MLCKNRLERSRKSLINLAAKLRYRTFDFSRRVIVIELAVKCPTEHRVRTGGAKSNKKRRKACRADFSGIKKLKSSGSERRIKEVSKCSLFYRFSFFARLSTNVLMIKESKSSAKKPFYSNKRLLLLRKHRPNL